MKILLTNDDGIDAPGLKVLRDIALEFTTADNIFTVAPATEQSGVGHAITYTRDLEYERRDTGVAVFGTPADCVLVGCHQIMNDTPDLILSGVNRGNNAGENAFYSGTLGAAIEGALQGCHAIALSQFYGPALKGHDVFSASRSFGVQAVTKILDAGRWENGASKIYYNVNFPPMLADAVKGAVFCAQGFRKGAFSAQETGRNTVRLMGTDQAQKTGPGTDVEYNLDGYVTLTPCTLDLTVHDVLKDLNG
ncbi:MAG: 5'/3'-nucleotidase SurE [Pseudomonadota bacterium]